MRLADSCFPVLPLQTCFAPRAGSRQLDCTERLARFVAHTQAPRSILCGNAPQPQQLGGCLHGAEASGDVFVQGDMEQRRSFRHVVAAYRAGKRLILQLLLYPRNVNVMNRLTPLDQGTGRQKAGKLITRKQRAIQVAFARRASVGSMRHDGMANGFRPAPLCQHAIANVGVFIERRMTVIVEVVQKRRRAVLLMN